MKTPRIDDFDPNAKERKLNSSMDNFPAIEKPSQGPIQPQITRTVVPPYPQYYPYPLLAEKLNNAILLIFMMIN